jgi:hypothetical protein
LRARGWGSPNSDEGTCTVVLYMYWFFVVHTIPKTAFVFDRFFILSGLCANCYAAILLV